MAGYCFRYLSLWRRGVFLCVLGIVFDTHNGMRCFSCGWVLFSIPIFMEGRGIPLSRGYRFRYPYWLESIPLCAGYRFRYLCGRGEFSLSRGYRFRYPCWRGDTTSGGGFHIVCWVSFSIPIKICGCSYCGQVSFSDRGAVQKESIKATENTKGCPKTEQPFVFRASSNTL